MRVRYAAVLPTLLDDLDTRQAVALDGLYARLGRAGRVNLPWLSQPSNQYDEQPQDGDIVAFAKVGDSYACAKVTQRLWLPAEASIGLVVVLNLEGVAEHIDGVNVRSTLAEDGWRPDIRFRW